ncbi:MAG: PRC-barrel domain containing protein [Candidatus Thorarchaeota archaeon]|nr:PRC-barrel domain containing protein [Candidatus Thorarchaeota archaeon]
MFKCCNMKYSDVKNKDVVDAHGTKIGNVSDFIFHLEGNRLVPKSIVLAGGRIEEFLESIGARPDNDPVFTTDVMDVVEDDRIVLCADKEKLKTTLDPDVMVEGDIKLSKLSKMKVIDTDGFKVGNVIDVWFDTSNEIYLVLGGGFFEEALERLHAQPNIDLLASFKDIESITDSGIKLKWTKFQLESNCEKEYDRLKRELSSIDKPGDYRYPQLRLGKGPSRGMA